MLFPSKVSLFKIQNVQSPFASAYKIIFQLIRFISEGLIRNFKFSPPLIPQNNQKTFLKPTNMQTTNISISCTFECGIRGRVVTRLEFRLLHLFHNQSSIPVSGGWCFTLFYLWCDNETTIMSDTRLRHHISLFSENNFLLLSLFLMLYFIKK